MARLQQILAPARSAVIVVDVQNDFCSPEGLTATSGRSVAAGLAMIPTLKRLVAGARTAGVRIIFVQTIGTDYTDSEAWRYRASETPRSGNCREGTWGAEFYELHPQPGDLTVVKHRNSAFYNTRLDTILRALRLQTVVMTGVATNVSVETTARDAVQRDYDVVFLSDCTAAFDQPGHDATLENIRNYFGIVATCDEVLRTWGL